MSVDQGQIEKVLLNLYVNAWQAMSGAGELHIETENMTLSKNFVKPYNVEPGRFVRISVTDTGIGIDKSIQQQIFDPFFTTKKRDRGTGLGLASAYGIIRSHSGIIDVSSERGRGATFNIYLPVSGKKVSQKKPHQEAVLEGNETVLLVDDEEMIIHVGQKVLGSLGYEVLTALGGEKAIEILENGAVKIDIVILDMIMPGMDGGEVFDRIKEICPRVKILLSSGYSLEGQAKGILERGCDGFIQKPFDLTELSQKVREVLDAS